HAGAIDWIQNRFRHGRPATLYYDEVRTPTYCECLDPVLERALASTLSGVFHAGGSRPLSLYEIAQIVNRVGGYDPDLLHGCYRLDAGPFPPRAGNVAMESRRLYEALGVPPCQPWPASQQWLPTTRDWHYERAGEAGSEALLQAELYRRPPS
ncbi:MAG: sugar nucleotide-binding protein, partial [Planctomycetales bacterium]|nr:sugar nucleotide-binding protein [Planctomycetales bacterium]